MWVSKAVGTLCVAISSGVAAAPFVQVPAPGGSATFIFNMVSGTITACPASQVNNVPVEGCKALGTLNVTGVEGDPQNVAISFANTTNATVTNLVNGAVQMCAYHITISGGKGQLAGSCVSGRAN